MSFERDDPRLAFMPESEITNAKGHCDVMRDRWFAVCPERGLIFWNTRPSRKGKILGSSPQCNRKESIARQVIAKSYPWAEIKFFPLVMMPIDVSDY